MNSKVLKAKGDYQIIENISSGSNTYSLQRVHTIDLYGTLAEAEDMMEALSRDSLRIPNYVCPDRFSSGPCDDRASGDRMAGRF